MASTSLNRHERVKQSFSRHSARNQTGASYRISTHISWFSGASTRRRISYIIVSCARYIKQHNGSSQASTIRARMAHVGISIGVFNASNNGLRGMASVARLRSALAQYTTAHARAFYLGASFHRICCLHSRALMRITRAYQAHIARFASLRISAFILSLRRTRCALW